MRRRSSAWNSTRDGDASRAPRAEVRVPGRDVRAESRHDTKGKIMKNIVMFNNSARAFLAGYRLNEEHEMVFAFASTVSDAAKFSDRRQAVEMFEAVAALDARRICRFGRIDGDVWVVLEIKSED